MINTNWIICLKKFVFLELLSSSEFRSLSFRFIGIISNSIINLSIRDWVVVAQCFVLVIFVYDNGSLRLLPSFFNKLLYLVMLIMVFNCSEFACLVWCNWHLRLVVQFGFFHFLLILSSHSLVYLSQIVLILLQCIWFDFFITVYIRLSIILFRTTLSYLSEFFLSFDEVLELLVDIVLKWVWILTLLG